MDHKMMRHVMSSVVEDMGRAARAGRARRFAGKKPHPVAQVAADVEVDPVKEAGMDPNELAELEGTLAR